MGRNLKLDDQGNLKFFEGTGGGTSAITLQGPSTLAGNYTLTLPLAQAGGVEFLQNDGAGVLSWSTSTATLDSAYDNGSTITVDTGAIILNTTASIVSLDINKTDVGAGTCITIDNDGTGTGIALTQTGAANGIVVAQNGAGRGINVTQTTDNVGIFITKTGTGAGSALSVENDGTGRAVFIDQDGAGIALDVDQDGAAIAVQINQASAFTGIALTQAGAGIGLDVNQDGAAIAIQINQATDNVAVDLTQAGDAVGLNILKSGTVAGDALAVENDGTGKGVFINQDGAGIALDVDQDGAAIAVQINQATANAAVDLTQAGDAVGITILKSGTGAGIGLNIENDGTGIGVVIDQDGAAIALSIDSEATASPLIDLAPVTGNTRGDIAFGTARLADPTSPSEGDFWYDAGGERLRVKTSAVTAKTAASIYGPSFGLINTHSIATGVVTATLGMLRLAAQTSTTDDLDTITASSASAFLAGDTMILKADTTDTITVKHNTGNIHLDGSADKVLVNENMITLVFNSVTTDWEQLTPMMVLP